MDGAPGLIHSADNFGINGAGLMITETTISGFTSFDPDRDSRVCPRTQGDAICRVDR